MNTTPTHAVRDRIVGPGIGLLIAVCLLIFGLPVAHGLLR